MKKRILALLLAMTMAALLIACGSSASGTSAQSDDSADANAEAEATQTDMEYVKEKGTLIVGVTDFEPMDYKDDSGEWTGFDAELAQAFASYLGVACEFVEIDWDNKVLELDSNAIDCVWNGMTLTDEVTSAMNCTNAYLNNAQVIIVDAGKAADLTDVDSLGGMTFAVEAGSAGAEQAESYGLDMVEVQSQAAALMEVAAGTADGAIIDSLMAAAMVGEGTSYENLTYILPLNEEKYGVGFRKDSDLASAANDFFKQAYSDGTMDELAAKYGVTAAVCPQ